MRTRIPTPVMGNGSYYLGATVSTIIKLVIGDYLTVVILHIRTLAEAGQSAAIFPGSSYNLLSICRR